MRDKYKIGVVHRRCPQSAVGYRNAAITALMKSLFGYLTNVYSDLYRNIQAHATLINKVSPKLKYEQIAIRYLCIISSSMIPNRAINVC